MVSKDGRAALIAVVMAGDTDQALKDVAPLHSLVLRSAAPGFTLAQTGDASLNKMADDLAKSDLERAEVFGVPVALIVLVLVFGAVLAAVMPLVLSICSILLAVTLTGLIGQLYPMNTFVLNILTMMGLAVGIDYTLFIISRYREERARGLEKIDAIAATGATANRAIFFSGMTVVLAMLGMVIVPVDITISLGVGVMLVVVTTLLTSLVLLPAVMGLLGDRVNALRVPLIGRRIGRHARRPARPLGEARHQHHAAARDLADRRRDPAAAGGLAYRVPADGQQQRQRRRLPAARVGQAGLGRAGPRLQPGQGRPRADRGGRQGGRDGRGSTASPASRAPSAATGASGPPRWPWTRPATSPCSPCRWPATPPPAPRRTSSATCAATSCRAPSPARRRTCTSPAPPPTWWTT